MNIKFRVARGDSPTTYVFDGDKVVFDGLTLDFSQVPPGAEVLVDELETNKVVRAWRDDNGVMWVELRQEHGPNASYEERFPKWHNPVTGEVIELEDPV